MGYTVDVDGTITLEWVRGRVVMDEWFVPRLALARDDAGVVVGEVRWWDTERNIFEVVMVLDFDVWHVLGGALLDTEAVRCDARGELEAFVRSLREGLQIEWVA